MITKRQIYQVREYVDSAIDRLSKIASRSEINGGSIQEIIARDLSRATEQLDYLQDIAL